MLVESEIEGKMNGMPNRNLEDFDSSAARKNLGMRPKAVTGKICCWPSQLSQLESYLITGKKGLN